MTIRTAVLDALAIGGMLRAIACLMLGAGFLAWCAIGTEKGEARPLLATMGWLHRVQERIWPAVGRHIRGLLADDEDWHPLDEETGDGEGETEALPHRQGDAGLRSAVPQEQPGDDSERGSRDLPQVPGDSRHEASVEGDELVSDGFGGWLSPECAVSRPLGECSYRDCADPRHDADDLTTGDDYDTDTLRIFADARAEHLVPTHEPAGLDSQGKNGGERAGLAGRGRSTSPPSPAPGLSALDQMIEAARQHTTADPVLLPAIRAALGFDSVELWADHWDSMRRKLSAGAA